MKYYSEKLNKVYDTEKECMEAEFEAKKKANLEAIAKKREEEALKAKKEKEAAERKEAAEKVEEARKEVVEAQKKFHEALSAFCERWGAYHFSASGVDALPRFLDFISDWF